MSHPTFLRLARLSFLLFPLAFSVAASGSEIDEGTSYSPKLCLRTNSGILKNTGSEGGSAFSVGGLDLSVLFPVGPGFFLGLGYQAHFDFKNKSVPFSSLDIEGRFYVYGQGTRSKTTYQAMTSERNDTLNIYLGADFGRRDYFLGAIAGTSGSGTSSTTSTATSGNSLGLNGALGLDVRLTNRLQFNLEGNAAIFGFAASDERYIISGFLLKTGISYLW